MLNSGGPSAVTMRAAARMADLSPSSTVYYFDDHEELLAEAAKLNIRAWAHIAETIADEAENHRPKTGVDDVIEYLIRAMITRPAPLLGHYLELISAGDNETISNAYHAGRGRLNNAISRILAVANLPYPAELRRSPSSPADQPADTQSPDVTSPAHNGLRRSPPRRPH